MTDFNLNALVPIRLRMIRMPEHSRPFSVLIGLGILLLGLSARADDIPGPVSLGNDGKLLYTAESNGDQIPDFSYAGYRGGDDVIPDVQVKITVAPVPGDNTARLQAALDYVATLPLDAQGLRGAVLLDRGRYEIHGGLRLNASGVVLRGRGTGEDGTVLVATGLDRRTLIAIGGRDDRSLGEPIPIDGHYTPVNARKISLAHNGRFQVGDLIQITRPSTREWIAALGLREIPADYPVPNEEDRAVPYWKPGTRDIVWTRTVAAVDAGALTLDAPLTASLDQRYGGGTICSVTWPGRISQVGVENLSCESTFDLANPKDEEHAWFAITLENVTDAWVRQLTMRHFAGSAVAVWNTASRITVEDCSSFQPVSEIGGWRRNTFFTSGQQVLMQRLYSEDGAHDFAVGFAAAGPNAFVQCESIRSLNDSGAIESWACGALFDLVRIDGHKLGLRNRGSLDQGSFWSAANSVIWNCSAAIIECFRPPTAQNWVFGTWGEYSGDGFFFGRQGGIEPRSLYYAQLADRLGPAAGQRAQLMPPASVEVPAGANTADFRALWKIQASEPASSLRDWIRQAAARHPILFDAPDAIEVEKLPPPPPPVPLVPRHLVLQQGLLTVDGALVAGRHFRVPIWNGGVHPADLVSTEPAITRFVPGRTGPGLTDILPDAVSTLRALHIAVVQEQSPVWYDRRRDYHDYVRRMDGEVIPPFYENPSARSGQGIAWDGLSLYDLTKFNPWYWNRNREFASLCATSGLVLFYDHFYQHSLLESGGHYSDFPWRTANNINQTALPEPPYYPDGRRVFLSEQFYDAANPARRPLMQGFIEHALDAFAGQPNVIQFIDAEYSGPLAFMQFWLDTVAAWEKRTGQKPLIGLNCTKDVQDAILSDPARAPLISVIDIRFWWPSSSEDFYAPAGGQNAANREWDKQFLPAPPAFADLVRCIRDYRRRYADKAVIYSGKNADNLGWAVIFGGGSLPNLPEPLDPRLAASLPHLKPLDLPGAPSDQFTLGVPNQEYLICCPAEPVGLDLSLYHRFQVAKDVVWLTRK
jgi:hypothetical protein